MRNVLKVCELNHSVKDRSYQEGLRGKYEVWRGGEVESVEKQWEKFRDIVMECNNEVCGMRGAGGQRRKGLNGGIKLVQWWPKREARLRNSYREEMGLPMTDTGHRECL